MKELNKIEQYVEEIIKGNDNNLKSLKEELKSFFHEKTQKDFDQIDKKILQQLVRIHEILDKKVKLNEIDRALLDNAFNEEAPLKYFWLEIKYKLHLMICKNMQDYILFV